MVVVHHIFGWSHRFAQCTQSFQRILQLFLSLVQTICQQTGYIFLIVTVKRFGGIVRNRIFQGAKQVFVVNNIPKFLIFAIQTIDAADCLE